MDLNPLSTPNNILTDCINGTFITYNGNEFSLQNDQGNYKLEYCKLTPNYIPVGIKEYGDILYIVSQNPLDDCVEIGSYPSPLMVTVPDEKENNNEFDSIVESQILDKGLTEGNYTTLMENAESIIFNGNDYKLNPGDEYCLQPKGNKFPYKYETIEYHILDEDSNTHDVTDKIVLDPIRNGESENTKDFQHVSWTVPGWLSVKARLAELSVAGINIRSFYVPKNDNSKKTAHFAFNLRLNINDEYLTKKGNYFIDKSILDDWCNKISSAEESLNDVRFRIFIEKETNNGFRSIYNTEYVEFGIKDEDGDIPKNFFLNEFDWTEWYGESRVLWKNISGKIENLKEDSKVRVRMIPVLYDDQSNYKIVYDNLEQSLLFDLASVEDDEWNIGTDLYQFYVDSNKTSQYIYTNISGPMISNFPVNLYADIYNIDKDLIIRNWHFTDYSGIGENLLQIPFGKIVPEEIYVIKFKFAQSDKETNIFDPTVRFLITSEVFNDFTNVMIYDRDINLDEWIKAYWDRINVDFSIDYQPIDNIPTGYLDTVVYENSTNKATDGDKKYLKGEQYNTFFSSSNPKLSDSIKYRKGFWYDLVYKAKSDISCINGPIWNEFNPEAKLTRMDYSTNQKVDFEQSSNYRTIQIPSYLELLCKYQKQNMPFEWADVDIWRMSDYLDKFSTNSKTKNARLYDFMCNCNMYIYGDVKHSLGTDDDDIVLFVSRLLKNNSEIKDYYYEVRREGQQNEVTEHKTTNYGFKGFVKILKDFELPCLLVKIHYELRSDTDFYKMTQIIAGGPHDGNIVDSFVFRPKSTSYDATLYFIAFLDQSGERPVLIPLTSAGNGEAYFKTFCKNLSILLTSSPEKILADRYILTPESITQCDHRLTIYSQGQFKTLKYKGKDLTKTNVRLNIINSLKEIGDIKNTNILLNVTDIESVMFDDSNIVFDKELLSDTFSFEKFPYVSNGEHIGIYDVRSELSKLQSNSMSDFNYWNDLCQSSDSFLNSRIYCDKIESLGDSFLETMGNGFNYPYIKLSPKQYSKDDGITAEITEHAWKSDSYDAIISDQFKNNAVWYVTNADGDHPVGSDHHIILGECLELDPRIKLDYNWNWITGEN